MEKSQYFEKKISTLEYYYYFSTFLIGKNFMIFDVIYYKFKAL